MDSQGVDYQTAENLRKGGHYQQALDIFWKLWDQSPDRFVGWRLVFCLRKSNRLEDAEKIASIAMEYFPDDRYTARELAWVVYQKEIKPSKDKGELGQIIYHANRILGIFPDDLVLLRTVFAVMKVAKDKGKWDIALEWSDKLNGSDLASEPNEYDGRKGLSDREIWYINRTRALLELEQFDRSRDVALTSLADFPKNKYLHRISSLALAGLGNVDEAIDEYRKLVNRRDADWYFKAELAKLLLHGGRNEEAYRWMCESLLCSQDNKFKLGYFEILGEIAIALNLLDVAVEHIELIKAIRLQEDWTIPESINKLEEQIHSKIEAQKKDWPSLPKDQGKLASLCRQRWQEGVNFGRKKIRGTVKIISKDKKFTFIEREDGEDDVFVLVRDLPKTCNSGATVEFFLKKSFDRKKNKESVRAVSLDLVVGNKT